MSIFARLGRQARVGSVDGDDGGGGSAFGGGGAAVSDPGLSFGAGGFGGNQKNLDPLEGGGGKRFPPFLVKRLQITTAKMGRPQYI